MKSKPPRDDRSQFYNIGTCHKQLADAQIALNELEKQFENFEPVLERTRSIRKALTYARELTYRDEGVKRKLRDFETIRPLLYNHNPEGETIPEPEEGKIEQFKFEL